MMHITNSPYFRSIYAFCLIYIVFAFPYFDHYASCLKCTDYQGKVTEADTTHWPPVGVSLYDLFSSSSFRYRLQRLERPYLWNWFKKVFPGVGIHAIGTILVIPQQLTPTKNTRRTTSQFQTIITVSQCRCVEQICSNYLTLPIT